MQANYMQIWPYLMAALVVFAVYRRLRRSFGRQLVQPARMKWRIGILCLLAVLMVPAALTSGQFAAADFAGLIAGVALGVWGAERTKFQTYDGRLHYIPHTYTGIAVSLLFLARLAYRVAQVYAIERASGRHDANFGQVFGSQGMTRSPFTVGLLFVVIGYYVCYYSLVLRKSARILPEDLEVVSTSTAAAP